MMALVLGAFIGVLLGFVSLCVARCFYKEQYHWPVITQCRCCDNRIFAWQKYQKTDYECVPHLYDGVPIREIKLMGYKHSNCSGAAPVEIDFYGKVNQQGLVLHPKESVHFGLSGEVQDWLQERLE